MESMNINYNHTEINLITAKLDVLLGATELQKSANSTTDHII